MNADKPPHSYRLRHHRQHTPPFWQADRPYLHEHNISDARFRRLGYIMAFLAGAINAGGFFAFARYISHVTGSMSLLADVLYRGSFGFSMWLEAVYLLIFGWFGIAAMEWDFGGSDFIMPSLALFLLCFIMGMHNTVITLLSGGAIRSTHMTGTATDLGIEISRALYYSKQHHPRLPHVRVNKPKMWLLSGLMLSFLLGGVVGAWGYHLVGHHFALPVSAVLLILGAGSVGYDVKVRLKWAFVNWYRRKQKKRKKL